MTTTTDQLGRVLAGRYRIEAVLGTGASAHVYRASDLRLGRAVALKLLHPGLGDDEAFLRRFRAEAQTVATLSHANLVRLYDWGFEERGEAFLVLEYLPGGSLRDLLDDGVLLSVSQAALVGAAAARGLAYAHRRGLVHRDVKPANLLFDEEGVVRVADFGLARALADAAWTEPIGTMLGTARYASPEQAEGRPLDGRSDVYALALVLYEAVTGDVPFRGDTTLGTLRARVGATLPPARELGPLYPLLAQATISEPLARFDANDLAVELETLVLGLGRPPRLPLREAAASAPAVPLSKRPMLYDQTEIGRGERRDDQTEIGRPAPRPAVVTHAHEEQDEQDDEAPRRRHRGRKFLAFVVLLALLAGGAYFVKRDVIYDHVVPQLSDLALSSATSRAAQADLHLVVASSVYSANVAKGSVLSVLPATGSRLRSGATLRAVVSLGPTPVAVPHVETVTATTAEQTITNAHLTPEVRNRYSETVTRGVVMTQSPAKGAVRPGSKVILVVSLGPRPRTLPTFPASSTYASAAAALTALRLVPYEEEAYSSTVASGAVIATTPAEGTGGVAVGSRIEVLVSKGPQLVAVPQVAGQLIATAVANLQAAGLRVTEVVGPPFATQATTTDPAPGSTVTPGTAITLYSA